MKIIITVEENTFLPGDEDFDYERWMKIVNEGEGRIPVRMSGHLEIRRLRQSKDGEAVAECDFNGVLVEEE